MRKYVKPSIDEMPKNLRKALAVVEENVFKAHAKGQGMYKHISCESVFRISEFAAVFRRWLLYAPGTANYVSNKTLLKKFDKLPYSDYLPTAILKLMDRIYLELAK